MNLSLTGLSKGQSRNTASCSSLTVASSQTAPFSASRRQKDLAQANITEQLVEIERLAGLLKAMEVKVQVTDDLKRQVKSLTAQLEKAQRSNDSLRQENKVLT